MTTPTRFTAEDYAAHVREGDLAEPYLSMLRQAAGQARTLEQIRQWVNEPGNAMARYYKFKLAKLLDGETAR